MTQFELTYTLAAPIAQVYDSFVNRDNLCDWLAYDARILPEQGGYLFAVWDRATQEFASGTFTALEENKSVAFTWQYTGEGKTTPVTQIEISLGEKGDTTTLAFKQSGLDEVDESKAWWTRRLDMLQSILETGANLEISERIIIGIIPAPLDETIARDMNFATAEGARIGSLVSDYSAEKAGLQPDDIVVRVNGVDITASTGIYESVRDKKPGDEVEVVYYRGKDKHMVTLELKGYPVPPIPASFKAMADERERLYADFNRELTAFLVDVSDEAADFHRDENERSIRETLAHLILSERHTVEWLASYIQGPRIITPYINNPGWIKAIITAHPGLNDLMAELRRAWAEVVAIIREMPVELEQRKNALWWMTFEMGFSREVFQYNLDGLQRSLDAFAATEKPAVAVPA